MSDGNAAASPPPAQARDTAPAAAEDHAAAATSDTNTIAAAVAAQNAEEAQLETWLATGDSRAVDVVKTHRRPVPQALFDEVVRENVEDLELTHVEAVADAREQLGLQGYDCSNVVATPVPTEAKQ